MEESLNLLLLRHTAIDKIFVFSKLQKSWINLALENNIWINASHFEDLKILVDFFKIHNATNAKYKGINALMNQIQSGYLKVIIKFEMGKKIKKK